MRVLSVAPILLALACPLWSNDIDRAIDLVTPVGAERTGNVEGTISAWTGGILAEDWPADFEPGGRHVDPYANDPILFEITSKNVRQHARHLSEGQRALFRQRPSYRMLVYPTRRSVSFPAEVLEATRENRGRARLVGTRSIEGAHMGFPFPEPRTGVEVLWNHRLRYRGDSAVWDTEQRVVLGNGSTRSLNVREWSLFAYANLSGFADAVASNLLHLTILRAMPIRGCGRHVWLWHEPFDARERARQNWYYCETWRSGRAPQGLGGDDYSYGSEQLRYFDMIDMYTGEFDRYSYKLMGKRELYVPYNSFRISDGRTKHDELLPPEHFNPKAARYELHRVWVVEAHLRPGATHDIRKRVFYVDEDSWIIVLVDVYESDATVSRLQEGHLLPLYEIQSAEPAPQLVYDLRSDRYFASRLIAEGDPPAFNSGRLKPRDFTPTSFKKFVRK